MERIVLGKTGLNVNRLGYGGIPIQRVEEEQAVETVVHAINCGVDFIDTARGYTNSEERIGKALYLTAIRPVLATKSQQRTSESIRSDIEISLNNLQTDFIDLYQCHLVKNNEDYQRIISNGGALEGMIRAKEEGLIGHIGITSHSLDLIDQILDDDIFDTIMVCFSFLEPDAKVKVIPKATAKNIGVIVMKPFSGGTLEDPRLALKYVLSQPGVVIIPGVESKALFDENWKVYQENQELSIDEKRDIEKIRQHHDKNFCRRCDYCLPCTEDISIQLTLGTKSIVKRFGPSIFKEKWMLEVISRARHCAECAECVERCPYELPIPELIKANIQWFDEKSKQ